MAYAFKRAEGFVMITGRPGTGKTTLIGELVESLSTDKVVTANKTTTVGDIRSLIEHYEAIRFSRQSINQQLTESFAALT